MHKLISITELLQESIEKLIPYCDVTVKILPMECSSEDIIKICSGYQIVIIGEQSVNEQVLNELKSRGLLLLGCTRGTPVNVDWQAIHRLEIPFIYSPGRSRHSVAEFTIGLMIATTRFLALLSNFSEEGQKYKGEPVEDVYSLHENKESDVPIGYIHPAMEYGATKAFELYGRTLGLLGFGPIGREVCILAKAFNMNVITFDPYVDRAVVEEFGAKKVEREYLLQNSDIISNHMAVTPETRSVIDKTWFQKMKRGVYIINTGRAAVFNHRDFVEALNDGTVAGAGLDVFWKEPLPSNHPLWNMKNVVLTPHIAGVTQDMRKWQSRLITDDIINFCKNQPLRNVWRRIE